MSNEVNSSGDIESVVDDVKQKAEEAFEKAKEEAAAKLAVAKSDVVEKVDAAKEDAEDKIAARAASKPWTIIGWSALAGAVIGFLIGVIVF